MHNKPTDSKNTEQSEDGYSLEPTSLEQYLPEYIDGKLEPEIIIELERWLNKSAQARAKLDTLTNLLEKSEKISTLEPPHSIRNSFFAELSAQETLQATQTDHSWWSKLTAWRDTHFLIQKVAYSGFVFALGLTLGLSNSNFHLGGSSVNQAQVESLAIQVNDLKNLVLESQLQQNSTAQRLKAVRYGYELKQLNKDALAMLASVVNDDSNNHVRIAAAQVLASYVEQPEVEQVFIELCLKQTDRKVQLMLLSMLKDRDVKQAESTIKQLADRKSFTKQERSWLNNVI